MARSTDLLAELRRRQRVRWPLLNRLRAAAGLSALPMPVRDWPATGPSKPHAVTLRPVEPDALPEGSADILQPVTQPAQDVFDTEIPVGVLSWMDWDAIAREFGLDDAHVLHLKRYLAEAVRLGTEDQPRPPMRTD